MENRTRGYGLVETIFVMGLLCLFSLAAFTLVISGNQAYQGIVAEKDKTTELRLALSYVDTKLKQNDVAGAVSLRENPQGTGKAVVIQENFGEAAFETWIYWSHGWLREALVRRGEPVFDEISFEIAEIDGFEADLTGQILSLEAWRGVDQADGAYRTKTRLKAAGFTDEGALN